MELPTGDNSEDFPGRAIWYLAAGARQLLHAVAPKDYDPTNVRVLKEVLRWSAAVTVATAGVLIVLDPGPWEEL